MVNLSPEDVALLSQVSASSALVLEAQKKLSESQESAIKNQAAILEHIDTNNRVLQAVQAEVHLTREVVDKLEVKVNQIAEKQDAMGERVTVLETNWDNHKEAQSKSEIEEKQFRNSIYDNVRKISSEQAEKLFTSKEFVERVEKIASDKSDVRVKAAQIVAMTAILGAAFSVAMAFIKR